MPSECKKDASSLDGLRFRFLATQAGSIIASSVAELFQHSALSFSSMLMEGADFLISKATAYGTSKQKDDKSKLLSLIEKFTHSREKATKIIRTSAYIGHIAVAGVSGIEAQSLLGERFEPPSWINMGIMTVAAGLNLYNYIDARRHEVEGSTAMSLSGIKAMAKTNFAEVAGISTGVMGTLAGWEAAGNWAVMISSCAVAAIMGVQIIREVYNDPHKLSIQNS